MLAPPWHECSPACTAGWGATGKCHCRGCGYTFSTVSNFDKHRRLGACLTPEIAGLIQNKRGVYTQPGEIDLDERFKRTAPVPGLP